MESIVKKYAWTWSPNPRLLEKVNTFLDFHTVDNIVSYNKHIMTLFRELALSTTDFIIFPEYNKQGNIHYHGTLYMTDNQLTHYYRNRLKNFKKLGFVLMKSKNIDENWSIYQSKDSKIMLEVLNPLPVPITRAYYLSNKGRVLTLRGLQKRELELVKKRIIDKIPPNILYALHGSLSRH